MAGHDWIVSAIYVPDADPAASIFASSVTPPGDGALLTREFYTSGGLVRYRYDANTPPLDATRYTFPMTPPGDYSDGHHDYPASDIFTPIGTPVVACVRAEVLRTSPTDTGLGGIAVTLRGEDGWRYYYAHLSQLDPTIKPGVVVEAGTELGLSGNTGDARRTPPHLHFGVSKTGSAAGQIDPYPYLRLWEGRRAPGS